jgi:very-short-patch-repair endonuclease
MRFSPARTKVRLAIEIDGTSHDGRERLDACRDRFLATVGWRVLRIEEHLVFTDLDAIIATITRALRRAGHVASGGGERRDRAPVREEK